MSLTHVSKSASSSLVTHKQPVKTLSRVSAPICTVIYRTLKITRVKRIIQLMRVCKPHLFLPKHVVTADEQRDAPVEPEGGKKGEQGGGRYKIQNTAGIILAIRNKASSEFLNIA